MKVSANGIIGFVVVFLAIGSLSTGDMWAIITLIYGGLLILLNQKVQKRAVKIIVGTLMTLIFLSNIGSHKNVYLLRKHPQSETIEKMKNMMNEVNSEMLEYSRQVQMARIADLYSFNNFKDTIFLKATLGKLPELDAFSRRSQEKIIYQFKDILEDFRNTTKESMPQYENALIEYFDNNHEIILTLQEFIEFLLSSQDRLEIINDTPVFANASDVSKYNDLNYRIRELGIKESKIKLGMNISKLKNTEKQ
jgi:hypothetical protein